MSKKETTAALLERCIKAQVEMDAKAKIVADCRAKLEAALKRGDRLEVAVNGTPWEAVKYLSVSYTADEKALLAALEKAGVGFRAKDALMPRRAAMAEVRATVDGEQFPELSKLVRKCLTKHCEQKLKIGPAKARVSAKSRAA